MDLSVRLDILKNANMISEENYQIVQETIVFFKEKEGVQLTEENSAMFITHLCAALERIEKGENISPMDKAILMEIQEEEVFTKASQAMELWLSSYPQIPEEEKQYLLVHLCNLYRMII